MARQYWFASLLTNSRGAWTGRFMRPLSVGTETAADRAQVYEWASTAPAGLGQLILPADGVHPGWEPGEFALDGRHTVVSQGAARIHLDTGREPGWSFAGSGATLADSGWLFRQPPAQLSGAYRSPIPLIRLLAEIERDADSRELEVFFRADAELSYQLLRLLNSAAFAQRTPVNSLAHAITLLGRRQLHRWVQLLIYAKFGGQGKGPNPLLQLAAYRGHLLEELALHAGRSPEVGDAAFMTGAFSLLDRLIALPLPKIVGQLPLLPSVAAALAKGEGVLGSWLALATSVEYGAYETAAGLLESFAVAPGDWLRIQGIAYRWGYEVGISAEAPQ